MENTYSVRFCKGYSCPDRIDSMVISCKRLFVYKHAAISHNRFFQIRFLPWNTAMILNHRTDKTLLRSAQQFNPFISSCPFGAPPKTHHPFWRSNTEKDILRGKAENWKPISSSHHRFPWMPNYSLSCLYWTSEDRNITTKNEPLSFSTIEYHFVTYKSVSTPGICGLQWVLNAATPCKATRPIQTSIYSLIRRLTSVMPQVSYVVCTKEALAM